MTTYGTPDQLRALPPPTPAEIEADHRQQATLLKQDPGRAVGFEGQGVHYMALDIARSNTRGRRSVTVTVTLDDGSTEQVTAEYAPNLLKTPVALARVTALQNIGSEGNAGGLEALAVLPAMLADVLLS
jgi:hypothetical protein